MVAHYWSVRWPFDFTIQQISTSCIYQNQSPRCECGFGAGAVLVRVRNLRCGFVGADKFFGAGNSANDL